MCVSVCAAGNSMKINQDGCGGGIYFLDNSTLISYLEVVVIRKSFSSFLETPAAPIFCDSES